MSRLSIIIPTLNEEENLPRLFESLHPLAPCRPEIIVVDGGSTDETVRIAEDGGAAVLRSERGRGIQLRKGGEAASGHYLLFLHADSVVTSKAIDNIVASLEDSRFRASLFRLKFDTQELIYRLYAFFARFDSLYTSFGDQGLLICRDYYHRLGGFPPTELFEDVIFLRRARREEKIKKFDGEIITSARRFHDIGPLRLQLLHAVLLVRFMFGDDIENLTKRYKEGQKGEVRM